MNYTAFISCTRIVELVIPDWYTIPGGVIIRTGNDLSKSKNIDIICTHRLLRYSGLWRGGIVEATLHRIRRFGRKELSYSVLYFTNEVQSTIPGSSQFQSNRSHLPDYTVS
jgi:hypothetical protein